MKTRKKLILAAVLVTVVCCAWLAVNEYDKHTIRRGMPPGYYLECDAKGRYRACRNGRPLFDLFEPSSQAAAIRRAWDQYEYDVKLAGEKWEKLR